MSARKPTRWYLVTGRELYSLIAVGVAWNLHAIFGDETPLRMITNALAIVANLVLMVTLWTAPNRPTWERRGAE